MAEYKTEKQVNYGWGLSLDMTGKAPAIAKRIFNTLADAQAYADDINDSAIAGLQLSVINDADSSKNGIYFVKSIGDGVSSAILEQIGKGSTSGGSVDLSEYAKLSDLNGLVTQEDFNELASEIPTVPTFINGLEQDDLLVGIKIDSESEGFVSVSESGLKLSGIQQSINDAAERYLNTHSIDTKVIYLRESEWDELREQVALGNSSWENNVIYMVYSND